MAAQTPQCTHSLALNASSDPEVLQQRLRYLLGLLEKGNRLITLKRADSFVQPIGIIEIK
ncbi:hypothetical protein [Bartonella queenslandensis]|uniref:hypothetical protein n=1 Tax=Bartonella queenslandensis TaxID=481138 RepID=UPI001BA8D26E|nr:hypothetical protein [Bartonella queenslandensis]